MYQHDYWDSGWGWLPMSLMMAFWIVLIGAVIYVAIRLANRPRSNPNR